MNTWVCLAAFRIEIAGLCLSHQAKTAPFHRALVFAVTLADDLTSKSVYVQGLCAGRPKEQPPDLVIRRDILPDKRRSPS